MLKGDIREDIPNDIRGILMTSLLRELLGCIASLALFVTYKSIHVYESDNFHMQLSALWHF